MRRRIFAAASRAAKGFDGRPDEAPPQRLGEGFFGDAGDAFFLGMLTGLVPEAAD
jgi:hypothetical protein